jgi:hypothetical protein
MCGATLALLLVLYAHAGLSLPPGRFSLTDRLGITIRPRLGILPLTSRTYVISLPRRQDRYAEMERLRTRLGVQWSYIPAEDSASPLVGHIIAHVRSLRQEELRLLSNEAPLNKTSIRLPFSWPDSPVPIVLPFQEPSPPAPAPVSTSESKSESELLSDSQSEPLTCATDNFTLTPYSPSLPEYKLLSRSRIACWHSHLSAIQRAAHTDAPSNENSSTNANTKASLEAAGPEEASLILEDDVDMEADIKTRLLSVWAQLPSDWDVVFLGASPQPTPTPPCLRLTPLRTLLVE